DNGWKGGWGRRGFSRSLWGAWRGGIGPPQYALKLEPPPLGGMGRATPGHPSPADKTASFRRRKDAEFSARNRLKQVGSPRLLKPAEEVFPGRATAAGRRHLSRGSSRLSRVGARLAPVPEGAQCG